MFTKHSNSKIKTDTHIQPSPLLSIRLRSGHDDLFITFTWLLLSLFITNVAKCTCMVIAHSKTHLYIPGWCCFNIPHNVLFLWFHHFCVCSSRGKTSPQHEASTTVLELVEASLIQRVNKREILCPSEHCVFLVCFPFVAIQLMLLQGWFPSPDVAADLQTHWINSRVTETVADEQQSRTDVKVGRKLNRYCYSWEQDWLQLRIMGNEEQVKWVQQAETNTEDKWEIARKQWEAKTGKTQVRNNLPAHFHFARNWGENNYFV